MNNLLHQLANLSPEKRRVLEALLHAQGIDLARALIAPQPRDSNVFPLSFAQQRLWFLDQLEPGSARYNIPIAARLTGALDRRALARAMNEIVRRHESLRTRFEQKTGQPAQIIAPTLAFELPVDDLRGVPDREAEAMRHANDHARAPFDLTRAPLARARLLQLADDDHIILLTLHHIIADGWSMRVILRELAALYAAFVADKLSPLPELEIQYADYACWQKQWLHGAALEEQRAYWKKQLASSPAKLELPTDHARPATSTQRGAQHAFDVPRAVSASLKQLSQRENATLFMTLLSAFQVLLYRYTGQDDLCIGTPIANRNRAEIEDLVGFFVNTLVLRGDLSGAPTFRALLHRTRATTLDAYAHQDVPFEMLVDELHPLRDSSYAPLFQVMFALQTIADASYRLPQLTITPIPLHSGAAKFDLTFTLTEHADGVSGLIESSADLFDDATIARMAGHYETLLESIVANPNLPLTTYQLLVQPELDQILIEWNDTRADVPRDQCIHSLFEHQVEITPDALAVVYENASFTYRELNQRANQLARFLRARGVCPDTLVALCVARSLEMIVGILGILKAGGAYVPLDPNYPAERLAFMLEDSGAPILITQSNLDSRITHPSTPLRSAQDASRITIHLDADWDTIAREDNTNPINTTTPENLAYVIYTSGSTGKPKGVMIQHNAVVNLWAGLERAIYSRYPYHPRRVSFNAPLSFDASVQEWIMLLSGHTLDIIPHEVRLDGDALLRFIRAHRLDVLDCVPTQLKILLNAGLLDENEWTPAIVLPGGEAIDPATWDALARAPQTDFYNMYGPTECTVDSTICRVRAARAPSIGRPIVNVQHFILDQHLQPVPIGIPGELYIGGAGLARGYLNRPELTAEKFINHQLPFTNYQLRLYKTGDLARYRADGNIEYLGRTDSQIKLRGLRIELGEIEAALRQHSAVRDVAVIVRDETNDARLVAYIVSTAKRCPAPSELRDALRARLPDYMVPSAFVPLDALPLLPNGKLDRRALPAPEQTSREGEYVAPRTPVEELLAGIFAEILNVARVGIHDSFFDLGGHSLLATQVIARARAAFEIELPLRAMFESPTIAELARQIETAHRAPAPPIERVARDPSTSSGGALPVSFAQQRLWVLDQLEPQSAVYNIPVAVRIAGALDRAALECAFNAIIRRHETFRTAIITTNGHPAQVIAPELAFTLNVTDARDLDHARQLAAELARTPFDLARAPLFRARLVRLRDDDHILLLTMHHIISDGWSGGVLMRELAQVYAATAPLPELAIQYADFAAWQRAWLSGETLDAQIAFWKTQLRDAPAQIELPTDRARPAMQTNVGAHQTFAIPKSLADAFAATSRAENATLFMTYLAAFQTLLYRYSGQTDLCIGTPIANRHRAEIEGLIGFFVNTLVLRGDLSGEPTYRAVLQRARATTLDAYAHQDVPFEMIVNALELKRDLRHTPLFQVMFTFQNAANTRIEIPGITFDALDIETGLAMFDLTLTLSETSDGLLGNFEYNTDLFDAATIARMIGHFETLLQNIAANPNLPITTYQLLSDVERDQLAAWNNTAADFPRDQCLHELFENQVARTPDALAARCAGQALTYRELNARANQLARHLQNLGAQPETRIGVCVERSLAMVIALLGILKSGAAYLPLDPTYPTERLEFMLEDSGATIVVTQLHLASRTLCAHHASRICLDSDWDTIAQSPDSNPSANVAPENLAYVIYTSGSTGKPKGVMVEHCSVVNHNVAVVRAFELQPRDRVLQFATINFDAAIEEIFPALSVGATIVLRPEGAVPSGVELARMIETEQISVLDLPTAYWHAWVFEMTLANARVPECVRLLVLGGEKASAERMAQWQKLGGEKIRWLNTYGPTEGTIIATLYDSAQDARVLDGRDIPIGKPIANAQIHLLDSHLQPVPIGVPGELHIGGVAVARGYLNRPELTAEKFINYQLPRTNYSIRLYNTGDLARYRADGNIEFLGRADHQVKVRGMRVELGEIETTLEQHPAIQHAAVIAREDGAVKRLVAYVATRENLEDLNLREFLRAKLPDYAMPALFVALNALPLMPNGKVDRRALPAPAMTRAESANEFTAPQSRAEEILARVWRETLGVARIGIHDNFFELGGDSILAIQVIARAHQAGLALTPKQLFQQPTIAGLARVAGLARAVDAEQASVTGDTPLTPIQRWFFEQNFVEPHHWNQALLLQTHTRLDRQSLEQAIAQVLAHHDALRMKFTRDQTGWCAHIAEMNDAMPFEWIDLQNASDPARALETRAAELQASLNFENGFLLRAAYFDLGAARGGRLLLIAHHLVIDGVSWRVLLEDVLSAYTRAPLPPKTTSFKRWAEKLNAYDARDELTDWTNTLTGAPRLPTDARGENTEASARIVTVALDADETRALLRDALSAHHADINTMLLTALAQALTRWTGSRAVLLDVESHGRADVFDDVDVSRTVGWFTSVYPVQLQVDARAQPGEALRAIKEQLRRVPNHGIGYGVLRYIHAQLRDLVQPEITFNYLGQADHARAPNAQFDFAPEASGAAHSPRNARTHLLDLNGGIADGCLRIEWTFSENIHHRATIERVARDFLDAVRALIRAARAPDAIRLAPSDFPLAQISQRKLDQVLARVGQTR